ncbi:hypothetical protein AGMMS49983_21250 [Clostridia bacterium]|nr:hypothetical protein AGMMS49983_21250 [Clostridia bacterium]
MPGIVGLTTANAQKAILDAGFRLGIVHYEAAAAPVDSVIAQTPKAGEMLVPGTPISFTISTGPKVAEATMPSLIGKSRMDAEAALGALKLTVSVTEDYNNTYAPGLVSGQSPAQGTVLAEGSAVSITVSKGPQTAQVPNLTGMTPEQAKASLEAVGLKLGAAIEGTAAPDENSSGKVYSQDTAAGITVALGFTVNVIVYKAYAAPAPSPAADSLQGAADTEG